jgi:predicted AAA+ superfamily ATPase
LRPTVIGRETLSVALPKGTISSTGHKSSPKLHRELDNSANLLLVAPRRVGKTSLVIRLCKQWGSGTNRKAVFLNVEGRADELSFAEKLIDELAKAPMAANEAKSSRC